MAIDTRAPGAPTFSVIGTRPIRPDGLDKVTGRAVYGADVLVIPHPDTGVPQLLPRRTPSGPALKALS